MKRMLTILFAAVFLAGGFAPPAQAALQAVGPVNPFNGYPLWYQDTNGLRLDLCLDNQARNAAGDLMCGLAPEPEVQEPGGPPVGSDFNPDNDIVFPGNFPSEAFWWSAEAAIDDTATGTTGLLVLASEGAFGGVTEGVVAGEQVAFGRIRIRISVPSPGLYTVEHPFGTAQYNVTAVDDPTGGGGNEINQTQDLGCEVLPCDFTLALADGPVPPVGPVNNPALNQGIVNTTGNTIGPFLVPAASAGGAPLPFIVHALGRTFIADPAVENFVTGAPSGFNHFRIVGPAGSGVDVTQELFSVTGMLSQNQPAPVNRAEYRVKTGKFHVQGTSAAVVDGAGQPTVITIHLGADATGPEIGQATVDAATGLWHFTGKAAFSPGGPTQTVATTSSADPGGIPQVLLLVLR